MLETGTLCAEATDDKALSRGAMRLETGTLSAEAADKRRGSRDPTTLSTRAAEREEKSD